MNRAWRRSALHDLRNNGCTCIPIITPITSSQWIKHASYGAEVRHRAGCDLGDRMVALNAAGIIPALIANAGPRCAR